MQEAMTDGAPSNGCQMNSDFKALHEDLYREVHRQLAAEQGLTHKVRMLVEGVPQVF